MGSGVFALAAAVFLCGIGSASAQVPAPASAAAGATSAAALPPEKLAEQLLAEGVALRRQRREREALARFVRAFALHPTPRAAAQMGLAERSLADWIDAERHLSLALGSGDPWVEGHREALEFALASVQKRLGWLHVEVDESGLELRVDGSDPVGLPLDEPLRIAAGRHGYAIVEGAAELLRSETMVEPGLVARRSHSVAGLVRPSQAQAGEPHVVTPQIAHPPLYGAPPRGEAVSGPPPVEVAAWVSAGATVLSLGVAAVTGAVALTYKGQLSESCLAGGGCSSERDHAANAKAHGYAEASTLALGVAAVTGAVAAVLFVEGRRDRALRTSWSFGPGSLRVTF